MDLSKFFNGKAFIISLAIGIFFVYISSPENRVLFIYPNPDNVDTYLFKDKTDTCYKYKSNEIKCPERESLIMKYPIQTNVQSGDTNKIVGNYI
jgi:hypothetical protein